MQDSPQQLLIRMREQAGRVSAGEESILAQPLANQFHMRTPALNHVWSDGGQYYGQVSDVMVHTSSGGGVQPGQIDPQSLAINIGANVKNLETLEVAPLGLTIVSNSDGTFLAVSRVAY